MSQSTNDANAQRLALMRARIGKSAEEINATKSQTTEPPQPAAQTEPIPLPVPTAPEQSTPPPPVEESKQPDLPPQVAPLLYQEQPSSEYLMRTFDRQRDKGAVSGNPYLMGAIDAIGKLTRKKKYEMFDEMMLWYIEQHRDVLEARPDVVRLCEQVYKDKHHI